MLNTKYLAVGISSGNGIYKVNAFKEKPVLEKAQEYVNSANYLWNAGIFIWKAANLKKAFVKYASDINSLFTAGNAFYNTEAEAQFILDQYPTSPDISIDYAILEKPDNIFTIHADIGWSDLGTWASLHAIAEQDHNVCNTEHLHLQVFRTVWSICPKVRPQ